MGRDATAFEADATSSEQYSPGAYVFLYRGDERIGIKHACPCGCRTASALFFRGKGDGRPEWDVVGEWPKVTLSPSIGIKPLVNGVYHWHGYLENGIFVER